MTMPSRYTTENNDISPFEVSSFPWRIQNFFIFIFLFPFSFPFILFGILGCILVAPFYKNFPLSSKDKASSFLSWLFMVGTRINVRTKDRNLNKKDHSQLYVSPHICMAEVNLLMLSLGHFRILTAEFTKNIPVFNIPIRCLDPIYVVRGKNKQKGASAFNLLKQSIEETNYRHIIFPEGTYTNGKSIIRFKTGAFALAVPVTPVVFHYPKYIPFWNRQESSIFIQFYRLMSQIYTPINIEILPTYHPSKEERADPKLYASNVRILIAKHADRPLSNKTLEDSPNYQLDANVRS